MKLELLHDDGSFLDEVGKFAEYYGLEDWIFEMNHSDSNFGECHHKETTIYFSSILLPQVNRVTRFDVVLHEMAHAIAGAPAGHGPEWVEIARKMGCTARPRLNQRALFTQEPKFRWIGTCPRGHRVGRHRKPENFQHSCNRCADRWDSRFIFRWHLDGTLVFDPRLTPTGALV